MNWKTGGFIGFSAILLFYAFLYIATRKDSCDDTCQKIQQVSILLAKNRPFVYGAWECTDSNLCIVLKDTLPYNWNLLADTACIYLKTQSVFNYKVTVLNKNFVDTMGRQQCP